MEQVDLEALRQQASAAAYAAVEADERGDHAASARSYTEAANSLALVLESVDAEGVDGSLLETKIREYRERADLLLSMSLPAALPSPPDRAPAGGAPQDPLSAAAQEAEGVGAAAGAAGAAKEESDVLSVALKSFSAAAAAVSAARALDEQYQVSSTVAGATARAAEGLRGIETEYRVSERLADGVRSTTEQALKVEEEYQISTRVSTSLTDTACYAAELEERYQLRQRAAEALQQGWDNAKAVGSMVYEYDQEYKISEQAGQALQDSFWYAAEMAKETAASAWGLAKPAQSAVPPNASV